MGIRLILPKMKLFSNIFRSKEAGLMPASIELFKGLVFSFAVHEILLDKRGKPIDYRFIDVNPAFEQETGLKREEIIGKRVLQVLPKTERYWIERYGEVAITGKPCSFEFHSGELGKYYQVSAFSPKPYFFAVVFEDITPKVLDRDRQAERVTLYRNLFEQSNDMLILHTYDGRVVDASQKVLDFFGKARHEFVGHPLSNIRFDGDLNAFKENVQKVINKKAFVFESIWRNNSGHPVEVEVFASIYNEDKKLILANIRDISERKKSNNQHQETQKLFKAVFEQTAVGLALLDTTGRILEVNPKFCSITGHEKHYLYSKNYCEIIDGTELPFVDRGSNPNIPSSFDAGFTELRVFHKDGHPVWINQSVSIIHASHLEPVLFLAVINDVSEARLAQTSYAISETRLKNVLEDQSEFFITWKPDGTITYVNDAYCRHYDVSRETKLRTKFYDLIDGPTVERVKEKIGQLKPEKNVLTSKHVEVMNDGAEVWHEWTDRGFFDEDGQLLEIQSIGYDITKQVMAEEKLKIQNLYFEYLFNNLPQAIAVIDVNKRILRINAWFTKLFGYSSHECEGGSLAKLIVPEHLMVQTMNDTDAIIKGQVLNYESDRVDKYGRIIQVAVTGLPLISDEKVIAAYIIYRDVTQEKKSAATIKLNENRLETLLRISQLKPATLEAFLINAVNEAVLFCQSKIGFIMYYDDDNQLFELKAFSDSVNQYCTLGEFPKFTNLNQAGCWADAVRNKTAVFYNGDFSISPHFKGFVDGHFEIVNLLVSPVLDHGKVVAIIAVGNKETEYNSTDAAQLTLFADAIWKIVERQQANEALTRAKEKAEESDRLKTSFLATMSHELRTPLNAIIGFSGLMDDSYSQDEMLEYVGIINQSGNQLLTIINDLFNLSLLEAGNLSISKSTFKAESLFHEVNELAFGELKINSKTHIQLVYNQHSVTDNLDIVSDYQLVMQVLLILIKNAIKFTTQGFIEYGTILKDDEFVFYVKDTGIGIDKSNLELIFEKFRQVDESSTREFGGVGIGLTIAKGLAAMLNGRIWVESDLGQGSCFYFGLKLEGLNVKSGGDESVQKTDRLKGKKVLVVEDEESNYLLLLGSLKLIGVEVDRANNGLEAIAFLKENSAIDLILMDLKMPIMDGFTASTAIKAIKPHIPIIAQTAYAMVGDREKALDSGCDDYIAKPIRREALLELLRKYIG